MKKSSDKTIRLVLVEDDKTVREGLQMLLNGSPGFQCTGAYGSGEEALQNIAGLNPDAVLMDLHLPGMSGIECVVQLKERYPSLQIIVLTVFEDSELIFNSLAAGATGYLLKKTPPAKLLEAITEVRNGGSPMSSQIARKVVETFRKTPSVASPVYNLSKRENEIISCLAKGYMYKEIANQLNISVETVRTHVRNIYEKLHVRTRTEAVVKYLGK